MRKHAKIMRVLVIGLCLLALTGAAALAGADGVLRLGDRGEQVRSMQTALKAIGYQVKADGVFGKDTLAAVKLFQQHKGIKEDGAAGPVTLKQLNEAYASRDGVLRVGTRGDEVRKMQQALKDLSYPLRADGVFGPATLSVIKTFQARNSLRVDGSAGPATLGRLYSGKALGYAGETNLDTTAVVGTQRGRVLHLRSSRSDRNRSNILLDIPSGATVKVLSKGGDWTKVSYGGKTGYARTGFLRFPSTPAKAKVALSAGEAMVATQPGRPLNLRSSASRANNANIIAYIPSGTVVKLLDMGATWSKITYGSLTGYVLSGYLQVP